MSPDSHVLTFRPATISDVTTNPDVRARLDEADERARTSAYAVGFAAGARAAAAAAEADRVRLAAEHIAAETERSRAVAEVLMTLARAAEAVQARALPVLDEAVRAVHVGAITIAEHLLGRELVDGETSPRALLDRALAQTQADGPVAVHLHPVDLARVEALCASDADHALPETVSLVADATLSPGDAHCVLPTGFIDARVSTALARARTALLEDL